MNELPGASVMRDVSANGIDGVIGSEVRTGVLVQGATAYRWTHTQPNQPPPKPERLVLAWDDRLNPGSGEFAVTVRFRTTHSYGNMIQKGQAATAGGNFKWEIPKGRLTCLFRGFTDDGSQRTTSVKSPKERPLSDGAWHTVRCERTASGVRMTIDDTTTVTASGATGTISNDLPLTIAGKYKCNQETVTCDYFAGDIDWIRIENDSPGSPPAPSPPPPAQPGSTIFADDFSSGFSHWTSVTRMRLDEAAGSPQAPSARVQVSGESAFATKLLPSTHSAVCMSIEINETQFGSNVLMRLRTAANGPIVRVLLDGNGWLRLRSDFAGVQSSATVPLGSGWHTIKTCGTVGASGAWNLSRDGIKVLDQWTVNTGTTPIGLVGIGDTAAKTWTANIDQILVTVGQ